MVSLAGRPRWLTRTLSAPGPFLQLCLTDAEYRAALKHLGGKRGIVLSVNEYPSDGARTVILHNPGASVACLVLMSQDAARKTRPQVLALLAHEASHVVDAYFEEMNEAHPASEQRAYALQSVAQALFAEAFRRKLVT